MYREMVFILVLSSNFWRKTAADRASAVTEGDFFGANVLDKMTHADSFSK
jgi:hypothetical protein